jgi:serine/threonine-protein kinase
MCESSDDPIPPPLAAFIAGEVCAALDYIHTRKSSQETPLRIVHRDVSPHNILVSNGGEVKLADFGIAKSIIRED